MRTDRSGLRDRFLADRRVEERLPELIGQVAEGRMTSYRAARDLLDSASGLSFAETMEIHAPPYPHFTT